MPGLKNISTHTLVTANVSAGDAKTSYTDEENLGDVFQVFLNDSDSIYINTQNILEGHGIVVHETGIPTNTQVVVERDGDLIIIANDAAKYSLDTNGNLIYTS